MVDISVRPRLATLRERSLRSRPCELTNNKKSRTRLQTYALSVYLPPTPDLYM